MSSLENSLSGPPAAASADRAASTSHPMVILASCCLSLFLVTMDVTIVNIALPAIRRDLHASVAGLQWSIDGYTIVIASFLMLAGSMADRIGRRRVFQVGLGLFSFGSLLCSFAPTISTLILCRVVQAIGGSMLNPAAMSIITNTFTEPRERARAIGLWGAVTGVSMAAGPLLGGLLTETFGWRAIFAINVPVGLAAIALAARFIPESRAAQARRFDPVGQMLIIIVLATLIGALIEGPHVGWRTPWIVALCVTAVGAAVALAIYEYRRVEPLIDLRFFRSVSFSAATAIAVLAFTVFSGFFFLSSLYLQEARHLNPSDAGICMLPTAVAMIICAPLAGRLVGAGHARGALIVSGAAIVLGAALLIDLRADSDLARVFAAYTLFGIGLGLVNAPITNAAVSGMPRAQAGLAAALASTCRVTGAALGVALVGSIVEGGARGTHAATLTASPNPFWWIAIGCGLAIGALGMASTHAHKSLA
jgi:EmrB/QacA subfamily drug resistance transporter